MRTILVTLQAVLASTLPASAISPEAQELINRAAADCRGFENGEFDAGNAVTSTQLRSQFGAVGAELVDVGMNPGFIKGGLTDSLLTTLWCLYAFIHFLWFVFILRSPIVPNAQEAGAEQEDRVSSIKQRAFSREQ